MSGLRNDVLEEISGASGVTVRGARKVLQVAAAMFRSKLMDGKVEVRGIGHFTKGSVGGKNTVFFRPSPDLLRGCQPVEKPL